MLPVANPPNPWATTELAYLEEPPSAELVVYEDHTRTIVSKNDSPDVGFRFSVNPYRGCYHGCAYCYARPGHEYLSFGAGTDFERRIVVKPDAPALLREAFERPTWRGERVVFSGVTDCYQPLEAFYRLTRGCLAVCLEYKNPVGIITKAPLIERDLELLVELSRVTQLALAISIPFLGDAKARALEPHVTTPARRLRTVERLAAAGLDVSVSVAPLIPGLSEDELPKLLAAAKAAGARHASYVLLRLPGPVKEVFEARLREVMPLRANKILARIRDTRGGAMNDARFGVRGRGEGAYAEQLGALFEAAARKAGLEVAHAMEEATPSPFARPAAAAKHPRQLPLFGE